MGYYRSLKEAIPAHMVKMVVGVNDIAYLAPLGYLLSPFHCVCRQHGGINHYYPA
jgi:hypothetical protein